jgi:hypothetical protein
MSVFQCLSPSGKACADEQLAFVCVCTYRVNKQPQMQHNNVIHRDLIFLG